MNRLTSRKFLLALLTLCITAWLCAVGHIGEGVYSAVVIGTVGAYMAANVVQRVAAKDAP